MAKRAYLDIPAGQVHYQTEGSGDPLLLLHQGMFSSAEFSEMMPLLGKRYRVIARDMLGYGDSDVNPPDYTIADYALADIDFMKALGIEKTSIFAIHTGCSIAVEIALAAPEMIDKLVFYGLPTFDQDVRAACIKSYTFSPVEIQEDGSHLTQRLWKTTKKMGPHTNPANWNKIVLEAARASGGAFHGEHACFNYQEVDRISQVKHPVLLISGTGDVFHSRLEIACKLISNCRTMVVEEADLFVALEKPQELATAIIDFLEDPGS
jgi:pimeloyl-ACP methyl ester carboxylesterase